MSFLSKHIAEQTGTVDPVTGKGSPHHENPHHQPQPSALDVPHRVVMDRETDKEVKEQQ